MATARPTRSISRKNEGRGAAGRLVPLCLRPFVPSRSAFTLAESLIASVVLAVAVVGVAGAITVSQRQALLQRDDAIALSLARQLMEQVAALPIMLADGTTGQAGWPGATDSSLYDTANDFCGYTDTVTVPVGAAAISVAGAMPSSTVVSSSATPPPLSMQQYRRNVAFAYPAAVFGTSAAGDFAVATVTVTGATGSAVQVGRLFAKTSLTR